MALLNWLTPNISTNSVLILTSIILFAVYWLRERFSYWSRNGVPSVSPLECFKSTMAFSLGWKHMLDHFLKMHHALPSEAKFGGAWQLLQPTLIVRDPEMVRLFLIKGFTNFHDRGPPPDEKNDALSGNLFQLAGDRWRQVRHKLSPAFSAAKLKIMYQSLKGCANELNAYLMNLASETGSAEIDVKQLMSNYTLDVIGACAMGIKCNAIQDPNCEFKRIMALNFRFDWRRSLFFFLELVHPKVPKLLGLKLSNPEVVDFLTRIVRETMEMKEGDLSVVRKDFLQIMMNLRDFPEENVKEDGGENGSALPKENGWMEKKEIVNGESKVPLFSEGMITGVISSFLSAGFEPVSAGLTFALFELAQNPEVQKKMFDEIRSVKAELGDDINFESLKKFKYTDQVINETLRKRPVAGAAARICTEPFLIPDTSVVVQKGTRVIIVAYALQRDPKYFPEPEKFDPDRFSEENVDKIVPGSYLPFGDGPRFCIAMRLALMDIKTALIMIVSNYKILPCARTPKDIEYDPHSFILNVNGPLWLRLEKRK